MTSFQLSYFICGAALLIACQGDLIPEASSEAGLAAESPNCGVLASCCPTLPSEVTKSCGALASQALDTACAQELTTLQAAGVCRAPKDAGTPLDGSTRVDATASHDARAPLADAAVACLLLGACCGSPALPAGETATCNAFVAGGVESDCVGLLASVTQSMQCSGSAPTGGSCAGLQACCSNPSFPADLAMDCASALNAGVASYCSTQLGEYEPEGLCGAGDGGKTPPECSVLAMCCINVMFPESSQSTCFQVSRGGAAGACASAYDGYVAVGYCG